MDSINSFFQIAICVRGEFMIQIPGSYQLGNCLIFPHTKSAALSPGSACISSAYSIKRGFRYEQYPWRRRVVFINIRMLMTAKEADSIMKSPCFEVAAVVSAISAASEACPLRLPSLEQVLQQEAALRCLLDSSSSGL